MQLKTKNFLGGLAAIVIGLLCIGSLLLSTIDKVRTGHGLDYYFTGEGVQMNYVGALVAIAVAAAAVLTGLIIRFWAQRRDAWLEKTPKSHKGRQEKT